MERTVTQTRAYDGTKGEIVEVKYPENEPTNQGTLLLRLLRIGDSNPRTGEVYGNGTVIQTNRSVMYDEIPAVFDYSENPEKYPHQDNTFTQIFNFNNPGQPLERGIITLTYRGDGRPYPNTRTRVTATYSVEINGKIFTSENPTLLFIAPPGEKANYRAVDDAFYMYVENLRKDVFEPIIERQQKIQRLQATAGTRGKERVADVLSSGLFFGVLGGMIKTIYDKTNN